ncbi:MAG: 2-C-methyl-D-erythritol 4-phosphate cytidylyltransferase [Desulfobacteraceae bacterium]|jgi:2-C-methyl-D-erythritol 4-phosphate cytidylyltransferase
MQQNPNSKVLKTVAIIPAAGIGVRMGGAPAKQFLDFDGRPLLAVTLEKFQVCPAIDSIIAVVPSGDVDYCKEEIVVGYNLSKVEKIVVGGKRRQDSVRLGLEATKGDYNLVIIHDGVRPLVQTDLISRVADAAREFRAVITAMPAKETVKEVGEDNRVVKTYDRRRVWQVQTPQAFRYEDIITAHHKAVEGGWEEVTDDALLLEKMGIPIEVIEGSEDNIKVTTAHDFELARFLLNRGKSELR